MDKETEKMNYMIGCNYWDSLHGIDMWRYFDAKVVEDDFRDLAATGVKYIRMFPNWRDFQPACTVTGSKNQFDEYRYADDRKFTNPFLIDEQQIENFKCVCALAEKYGIGLIVSVLTGWMSGRCYTPMALSGRNLYTDPEALQMEVRFVRGFVRYMKNEKAIVCWDMGNECNGMSICPDHWTAYTWTALITNTIRSEDNSRPIMSGMHGLGIEYSDPWLIADQGENTDIMCVHPYPSPTVSADGQPIDTPLVTMTPSAQLQYYAGIGQKPACIQEQGTFSDFIGHKEQAAKNVRANIYSGYANGSTAYFWWCGFDQEHLRVPPYGKSFCENELGLIQRNRQPKPVGNIMKECGETLAALPFDTLPEKQVDAVFISSRGGRHFDLTRTAYILAKQAGFEFRNVSYRQEIPHAKLYMVASEESIFTGLGVDIYYELLDRVEKEGASLYLSIARGHFTNCENVLGLRSYGRIIGAAEKEMIFEDGTRLPIAYDAKTKVQSVGAEILAADEAGDPVFTVHQYGKGKVYFLGFPLERMLFGDNGRFIEQKTPYRKIYETIAQDILAEKILLADEQNVGVTLHYTDDENAYALAINYGNYDADPQLKIKDGWELTEILGSANHIPSCDMAVYQLKKK